MSQSRQTSNFYRATVRLFLFTSNTSADPTLHLTVRTITTLGLPHILNQMPEKRQLETLSASMEILQIVELFTFQQALTDMFRHDGFDQPDYVKVIAFAYPKIDRTSCLL